MAKEKLKNFVNLEMFEIIILEKLTNIAILNIDKILNIHKYYIKTILLDLLHFLNFIFHVGCQKTIMII